jgi:hypothetical protein
MRLINANEIQSYARTIFGNANGGATAVVLLYKDSRYDMAILDELYSPMGWQASYESINGVLYCTISVWDTQRQQWISKSSNGVKSNIDPEKGEASDALKRAGYLWGIGRELYTSPSIFINLNENEYTHEGRSYKLSSWVNFSVSKIGYDENRVINELEIVDQNGNKRFTYPTNSKRGVSTPPTKPLAPMPDTKYFKPMKDFDPKKVYDELVARIGKERAGELLKSKGFTSSKATWNMTLEQYYDIVKEADKIFYDITVVQEAGSNA